MIHSKISRVLLVGVLALSAVGFGSTSAMAVGDPTGVTAPVITSITSSGGKVTVVWKAGPGYAPSSYGLNVYYAGGSKSTGGAWKTSGAISGIPSGAITVKVCASSSNGVAHCTPAKAATAG